MMKRLGILLIALLALSSCENIFHGKRDVVARVGDHVLYGYELRKLIPEGTPSADSLRMVEQYIHSWAFNKLLMDKAERDLPKADKDISAEIEEFRKDLLTFRYEKYFLEQKLDTLVTGDEMKEWYDAHKSEFIAPCSVVKARVVRISKKSPYYREIKEQFNATFANEVSQLEELCYSSSEKYTDFGKGWVPATALASELGISTAKCESLLSSGKFIETDVENTHFIIFVTNRVAPGNLTPIEYNTADIHEMIMSKRKQDLLVTLEQELFDEAAGSKKFKRYI